MKIQYRLEGTSQGWDGKAGRSTRFIHPSNNQPSSRVSCDLEIVLVTRIF